MDVKQQAILFYSFLALIVISNVVLAIGLARHFLFDKTMDNVEWLMAVFGAEMVGCFVLAWRRVIQRKSNMIDRRVLIIQDPPYPEDRKDPEIVKKEAGREFLVQARNMRTKKEERLKLADQAIEIFDSIPPQSQAYLPARYNTATAYRIKQDYSRAISIYEDILRQVESGSIDHTKAERLQRKADLLMMIGTVHFDQADYRKAKRFFLDSWKTHPDDLNRLLNLHDVDVKLGNYSEAMAWAALLRQREDFGRIEDQVELIDEKRAKKQKQPADDTRD